MSEERAQAGCSLFTEFPAPPGALVCVCVCLFMYGRDNLMFETVNRILIEDSAQKRGRTGAIRQQQSTSTTMLHWDGFY